jgi:superfamily II DNA/RNA helicase
MQVLCLDEAD